MQGLGFRGLGVEGVGLVGVQGLGCGFLGLGCHVRATVLAEGCIDQEPTHRLHCSSCLWFIFRDPIR